MKLDLSCPIELRGYTLTADDGKVCADVRLYNLTGRRVASFDGVAKWRCRATEKSIACPFCAGELRAAGESGFRIALSTDRLPDADGLEILFTKVLFEDDGPDWRAGDGPFAELVPLPPIGREELDALRLAAGPDAARYPASDAETWSCVCGRVNPSCDDSCARCHRSREAMAAFSPENVPALCERLRAAGPAEPDGAEAGELHRRFRRERRRLMRRTLLMAAAILVLTILLVMSIPGDASVSRLLAGALLAD